MGHGLSGRNKSRRFPHARREGGAAHIEWKRRPARRQVLLWRIAPAEDVRDETLELRVTADELGAREAILQLPNEELRIVAERDRAYASMLAATRIDPREHSPLANWIRESAPPLRNRVGVMPSFAFDVS